MKKIISIFLTLLILISSTGIAMTTHFCGGHAMDMELAFGHAYLDCGMDDADATQCPLTADHTQVHSEGCCDNISISAETDEHNKISPSYETTFIAAFVESYLLLFHTTSEQPNPDANYSPPLLKQDIHVLYQSFLI